MIVWEPQLHILLSEALKNISPWGAAHSLCAPALPARVSCCHFLSLASQSNFSHYLTSPTRSLHIRQVLWHPARG